MEYEKCLVQVYEILNRLEDEDLEKIPIRVIKNIEDKMDRSYIWKYDDTKTLEEQAIDRKTVALLSYINMEYLLNEEERETLKEIHIANEAKLFPKIGVVNFSKPNTCENIEEKVYETDETALVEVNKQKWYKKVWLFFKQLHNK